MRFLMEVHDFKKNVEKKIVCGWSTSKTSASKFKCVILTKASNTNKRIVLPMMMPTMCEALCLTHAFLVELREVVIRSEHKWPAGQCEVQCVCCLCAI